MKISKKFSIAPIIALTCLTACSSSGLKEYSSSVSSVAMTVTGISVGKEKTEKDYRIRVEQTGTKDSLTWAQVTVTFPNGDVFKTRLYQTPSDLDTTAKIGDRIGIRLDRIDGNVAFIGVEKYHPLDPNEIRPGSPARVNFAKKRPHGTKTYTFLMRRPGVAGPVSIGTDILNSEKSCLARLSLSAIGYTATWSWMYICPGDTVEIAQIGRITLNSVKRNPHYDPKSNKLDQVTGESNITITWSESKP